MPDVIDVQGLLFGDFEEREGVSLGLANLSELPDYDPDNGSPPSIKGKDFERGVIGFRNRSGKAPRLAIACGANQIRYITLDKFCVLIENMKKKTAATIMLENFTDRDDSGGGRGQVLARLNKKHSAIVIVQGVTGRVIRDAGDIALYEVFYLPRPDLTAFYLAAKYQLSNQDSLDIAISAYDGWRAYSIPLDPDNPHELSDFAPGRGDTDGASDVAPEDAS
jgi:hypothetical protein